MTDSKAARAAAARHWFGYGRWSAPFWFIGMEPGGNDEYASYDSWLRLGGKELIDCRQHHLDSKCYKWHCGTRRKTQSTWRRLIQVYLAFENRPTNLDAVWQFQCNSLATADGHTALIELSALHAHGLNEESSREIYRDGRTSLISMRLKEHSPKVALFYGLGYRKYYERVTGIEFDRDCRCWSGKTLCVLTPHPCARSKTVPND